MDSEKGNGGDLHLEDGVPGNGAPSVLEITLSGLDGSDDGIVEIPDYSEAQYDFLLKTKLDDPCRETLPTEHSQWRLI